ncbi:MAG: hypothetical protein A2W28_03250 [Gammaproteobacteria bacterium RBG_16_51_14]|nr:MAG: hypothetical protein A2W28_03250 [Gammaproteobacteria bacterium RBG_16_51_14]
MSHRVWFSCLLLCLPFNTRAVESLSFTFAALEFEGFRASEVALRLTWSDPEHLDLTITSGHLDSVFSGQMTQVRVQCQQAVYKVDTIICEHGILTGEHDSLGRIEGDFQFTYRLQQGLLSMSLHTIMPAGGMVDIHFTRNALDWRGMLKMEAIKAQHFQGILALYPYLQGHGLTSGLLDGSVEIAGHADSIDAISAQIKATDLGIDGTNTLEGVTLSAKLMGQREDQGWHIVNEVALQQGAMYLMPGIEVLGDKPGFYLEVQNKPVRIHTDMNWKPGDRIEIADLRIDHPGQMQLRVRAMVAILDKPALSSLDLAVSLPDLAGAYPVYIQPLLLQTNFSDLEVSGAVDLHVDYADGRLNRFVLAMEDVYIDDRKERYSLSGVSANISLTDQADPAESRLQWEGMSLYRLDFGPGDIRLESSGRAIRVVDWQDVGVLDGTLQINNLSLKNVGSADFEVLLDGVLTPVSMQAFTQAMDWPLFSGKLSSVISGLKYSHNSIDIDGDIQVRVFDGDIILRGLRVWDVFSNYSTLATEIEVDRLDLEQLTDTFAFGKIEGSLSGRMERLKLEDWQPVYFEAAFASPDGDDRQHRISQKALENLNQIGGGLSGTLSSGFLKFFPTYSYGRIGFNCRLSNGICELGGVEQTADGFYLLTRGGLLPPWVDVKGTGHSIQWEDLIGGLKRIAKGEVSLE